MSQTLEITLEKPRMDDRYGEMCIVNPTGILLPTRYKRFADRVYNFPYRKDDICVFSFPKSGTTWTGEIIWAMTHLDDLGRAHREYLNDRLFMMDNDFLDDLDIDVARERLKAKDPEAKEENGLSHQLAALEQNRRMIWSHLPFSLQNPHVLDMCKVVYVMRHPKDNMFSRFNHFAKIFNLTIEKDLPEMAELFMSGDAIYGIPFNHIRDAWERRHHPNLHILIYEDMVADIMKELRKLNQFLELNLTEEQLQRVREHTSLSSMKANPTMSPHMAAFSGGFVHKGKVGASKGMLPEELDERFDAWIQEKAKQFGEGFRYTS